MINDSEANDQQQRSEMTNDLTNDPKFEVSILFNQNYHTDAHITVNQGGTSSGKTYAIEQVLFCLACQTDMQVITIVGQDIPNLKAGALRDALSIYNSSAILQAAVKSYNKSDRVFEFHNGSIMEFKSYTDPQDAKSGKRDYLFINEANGISYQVYTELALRTRKRIYIDYNPNTSFWVHEQLIGRPDVLLIISDHRHNPFLDQGIRDKIESLKKTDIELWKVYARGLTGKISGLIFTNWYVCEQIPATAKLIATGLDFGFTNDETACLQVYKQNGELWVHELFYQTGLTNTDIALKLKQELVSRQTEIIADSAEPKSIEEFKRMGWYISGAKKGADSIKNSIDILKRYKINVTRASVNLRKELDRYKWRVDRSGKTINEAVDSYNHLIDALRYVALNKLKVNNEAKLRSRMPYIPATANRGIFDELINPQGFA
ncbi:PBSX family phage terminase large subunit [Mucilaginibacter sp. FT3.2]|uniref:PBSX family phage terminase large subunit n=1 Tax=Mucilaginibacter sp. FT3.2 TaxID=2723090 RepID=UPI001609F37C|nr:PBSX family phage terminase large subunit [Mucilaginibacter sp. FT3.2]MBB6233270.1 phage terminase large subunit [Mucilaginibacter sp. FT3.2]